MTRIAALALILSLVPQVDVGKILEKADALLEEAKAGYEKARAENSAPTFVDAGFKLEEARIKYLVLQEVGSPEQQKTAADRMRAVNQLAKLIHDGKVAVSGAAVDSPSPPPPPAENKPDAPVVPKPAAKPDAPQVGAMMVDVSRRSVVPDAARQKDAEKIIKDLFKDQYAKKTAAGRSAACCSIRPSRRPTIPPRPGSCSASPRTPPSRASIPRPPSSPSRPARSCSTSTRCR
jgi:hypothetical protein